MNITFIDLPRKSERLSDEFVGMSIESLCSAIDAWLNLHQRMLLEGNLHCRIDEPISEYFDQYANIFWAKAKSAFTELSERTPETETQRGKRAWAIVKWTAFMMEGQKEAESALAQLPEMFS